MRAPPTSASQPGSSAADRSHHRSVTDPILLGPTVAGRPASGAATIESGDRTSGTQTAQLTVIGLMSGTSMDGIDVAQLSTDGRSAVETGPFTTVAYDPSLRKRLAEAVAKRGRMPADSLAELAQDVTDAHGAAISAFLDHTGFDRDRIDLIGFHGHTIFHDPAAGMTYQIGDGYRLAAWTGIDVVSDFRAADVAAGGQGAPLAPAYHRALATGLPHPVAILNIGGVANVTYIDGDSLLAFDTGPGNAMLDDWMLRHTGTPCDRDGRTAASGRVHHDMIETWLAEPYFAKKPPKSLDRNAFTFVGLDALSVQDGAATLTAFTIAAAQAAIAHLPRPPSRWLVTGGGRHNPVMMDGLQVSTNALVQPVEAVDWDGDALEAQAFGYLAVRAARCLPLSFPGTTGVPKPMTGAIYHRAPNRQNA
ncbi:anhydro-N-acetylmuramic acid kinase [Fodinicurvata sp. EGI_FJ10296]|uniref:anhydro-N-acetylmuramic acid kinase n=1 Tax=Fodinicurvata sp. EGI_FJ10296 TaxID=3231908 RepID=UPI0034559CC6